MTFAHLDKCKITKMIKLSEDRYLVMMVVKMESARKADIQAVVDSWECTNYNADYSVWCMRTVLTMVVTDHVMIRYRLTADAPYENC